MRRLLGIVLAAVCIALSAGSLPAHAQTLNDIPPWWGEELPAYKAPWERDIPIRPPAYGPSGTPVGPVHAIPEFGPMLGTWLTWTFGSWQNIWIWMAQRIADEGKVYIIVESTGE
ncbi:MAG: hypothetical protein AB1486_22090 [Planctomycetota bacterium]